jgi:hypothetical protein
MTYYLGENLLPNELLTYVPVPRAFLFRLGDLFPAVGAHLDGEVLCHVVFAAPSSFIFRCTDVFLLQSAIVHHI